MNDAQMVSDSVLITPSKNHANNSFTECRVVLHSHNGLSEAEALREKAMDRHRPGLATEPGHEQTSRWMVFKINCLKIEIYLSYKFHGIRFGYCHAMSSNI